MAGFPYCDFAGVKPKLDHLREKRFTHSLHIWTFGPATSLSTSVPSLEQNEH